MHINLGMFKNKFKIQTKIQFCLYGNLPKLIYYTELSGPYTERFVVKLVVKLRTENSQSSTK